MWLLKYTSVLIIVGVLCMINEESRHDLVGQVIHWEMCKKFRFDHTNKWYMHVPA